MTSDVRVFIINMDTKVREQITENADGSYSIFLNANLTQEQQIDSYIHAIKHILRQDFENHSADRIEYYAHKVS